MRGLLKILAAKICALFVCQANATGIPVIDVANLTQTTAAAIESVKQTLQQVEQYSLELKMYEDMIQNTLAPAAYVWDQATGVMNRVLGTVDTITYYRNLPGGLEGYMRRFQNASYYRGSRCFGPNGCSTAEMQAIRNSEIAGSEAQKRANDAMIRGIDQQQEQLRQDAANLERLQRQAETAEGRMAAIQAANQLASHQAAQLLQIRTLLVQAQAAEVARAQTIADREARQQASDDAALSGTAKTSPPMEYSKYVEGSR